MSVHPGSIWPENNWDPNILPNGTWVAANAAGIIETSRSLGDLYSILLNIGISFDDVAIAYVWFGELQ